GHSDSVTFIPHVPLAEIPRYYRSADICVVPSLYDNAPCTCLEALSTGKAIVTTSAGGSQEYVLDGECGTIVPPRNSAALAAAISAILADEKKRLNMGANGRQRVLDHFQRTTVAQQSVEAYQQAIDNYHAKRNASLYLKDEGTMLEDAEILFQSF